MISAQGGSNHSRKSTIIIIVMDKWQQFQAIHFDLNFFDQECCNTQSFKSVGEILSVSIQMKAIEQCFPVQGASNFWVLMSVKSFKCQIN